MLITIFSGVCEGGRECICDVGKKCIFVLSYPEGVHILLNESM